MPEVAAAVAAIVVSAGVAAAGGGILASIYGAMFLAGINYALSQAFQKPLENISSELITGIKSNTDGSITPHKIIYGKRRIGGAVVYRNLTDEGYIPGTEIIETIKPNENLYYHTIIALAGHEVNDVLDIYFNDENLNYSSFNSYTNIFQVTDDKYNKINLDGAINSREAYINEYNNTTSDTYTNSLTVYNLIPDYTSLMEIGDTFTIAGITQGRNRTGNSYTILQEFTLTASLNSNSDGVGTLQFTPEFRNRAGTRALLGGYIFSTDINRKITTNKKIDITSNVFFLIKKGLNPQFNTLNSEDQVELNLLAKAGFEEYYRYEATDNTPLPVRTKVIADSDFGNIDSFMNDISFIYLRLRYHPESFSNIPNVNCVVEGKKCYDPRTSTTVYTRNPALILRDYLISGYGAGNHISESDIDDDYVIASANICDELVSVTDGTQERYTCDLLLSTEDPIIDNINKILFSMLGSLIYVDGKYRIMAGAYSTPTITMDESWVVDSVNLNTSQNIDEKFNSITGIYLNAENDYSPTNIPTFVNETYKSNDNNFEIVKEIDLQSQTDIERAQRIASTFLNLNRSNEIINITCKMIAIEITPNDMVYVDLPRFSYSSRPYRVINVERIESGLFNITLKYEPSTLYDFNSDDYSIPQIGSNLQLPDKQKVWPPSNLQISEENYVTNNGASVKTKVIITFDPSPSAFTRSYQLEYKQINEPNFIILGRTQSSTFEINDIKAETYLFRVKSISETNSYSDYVEKAQEIYGLTDIPSNISNFSLNAVNNNAYLSWDLVEDIDVRFGGSIILKHSPLTTGATWSNSNLLIPEVSGKDTHAIAPLLSGTYLIKARDSQGNVSDSATTIVTNSPTLIKMNVVETLTENPTFTGTKTDMNVSSSNLSFDSVSLFDSLSGNFDDAVGSFDGGGGTGFVTSSEYEFSDYIDTGVISTSRIYLSIKFTIDEPGNYFDDYQGLFDSASGKFDGGDNDPIRVTPYISTTDDDPSGSPTWSSYRKFFTGDYNARAFKFKIVCESEKSNFNILISELSVTVDMPDIVDTGDLTTSGSGMTTVNFNKTFQAIPSVGGTILDGTTASDYLVIENITTTSFDIGVEHGGGYSAKDVSWFAKGY